MSNSELHSHRIDEEQVGFYVSVAPFTSEDDAIVSRLHSQSYAVLNKMFDERAMTEFSVADPSVSDDFRVLPIALCEQDWDGQEQAGQVVYSVWFVLEARVELDVLRKLQAMVLAAYTEVCGDAAKIVEVRRYQRLSYSKTTTVNLEQTSEGTPAASTPAPEDAAAIQQDFLKLHELANRLDAFNPELRGAFIGTPSERIERQLHALKAPGFVD